MLPTSIRLWLHRWGTRLWRPSRSVTAPSRSFRGGAPSNSNSLPASLLDPQVLLRLGNLDFIARGVVDGVMSGVHRSSHRGGCTDFEDHRPYQPGDEIRLIDWRLVARRDRYYIKRFSDETNLQAWMVLDTSGSMAFGMTTVTKFDYARMACAALARLLLRQRDAVGLSICSEGHPYSLPPTSRANQMASLTEVMQSSRPEGTCDLADQLQALAGRCRRRGAIFIFSDCFAQLSPLMQALQRLRHKGHDVVVFQIVAPEELSFDFRHQSVFVDLEQSSHRLTLDPHALRSKYLDGLERHLRKLRAHCTRLGCDLVTLRTDQPLGDSLGYYLRWRAAGTSERRHLVRTS